NLFYFFFNHPSEAKGKDERSSSTTRAKRRVKMKANPQEQTSSTTRAKRRVEMNEVHRPKSALFGALLSERHQ
ncbi:MAG: hypothetical protein COS76_02915, partial [Candidatus Portnoybacteria bacterium CG06_land_8_20_14_3_00_39_12]